MSFSKITVSGNIGRDPELKFLADGTALLGFSLAGNTGYGDKKVTTWYKCSIFGKKAESLSKHLAKGKLILVHGDFQIREWESNGKKGQTAEIRVTDLEFMGGKQEAGPGGYGDPTPNPISSTHDENGSPVTEQGEFSDPNDIPF